MGERIIRVQGTGHVSMPPDCIQVTMILNALHSDYGEAMRMAGQSLEDVRQALGREGVDQKDIRTTRFHVAPRYRTEVDELKNARDVFAGYEVTHMLKVEIDMDSQRLGRLLGALVECRANPQVFTRYKLRDENAPKEQLLRRAVQDAKAKATVLADSAGVTLGEMLSLNYSWGEIAAPRHAWLEERRSLQARSVSEFEPDNVEASDTVTVVWAIR